MKLALTQAGELVRLVGEEAEKLDYAGDLTDLVRDGIDPAGLSAVGTAPVDEIRCAAPLRPGKIVAIGLNYLDHCREADVEPPSAPLIFAKFPSSVIGPDEEVIVDRTLTATVDWEAELGVVIGRKASRVGRKEALDHVFGYTAVNDVSARDAQVGDGQWVRSKSLDTFCPIGPCVVTADELGDPQSVGIRATVNGVTMQESSTAEMIFGVAELIEYCSRNFTLEPGDLLITGTPWGVGIARDPVVTLQDGDEVVVHLDRIGDLRNTIRDRV
jgi:5-carboxymethyl-2-hydroxymuconate isomerase